MEVPVHTPARASRALIRSGLAAAASLVFVGGIFLHGAALVMVLVTGVVVGCVVYGTRNGDRRAALAVSAEMAAVAVAVILAVAGLVVLAGGAVATWVCGAAVVVGATVWGVRRLRARWRGAGPGTDPAPVRAATEPALGSLGHRRGPIPVSLLSTSALAGEWARTTAALASRVAPGVRDTLIRRRQETLDELERRDPVGFSRWLAAARPADTDPAIYLRGGHGGE
jgi:hypothetical protein